MYNELSVLKEFINHQNAIILNNNDDNGDSDSDGNNDIDEINADQNTSQIKNQNQIEQVSERARTRKHKRA